MEKLVEFYYVRVYVESQVPGNRQKTLVGLIWLRQESSLIEN
jgi:hypothetical protein